MDVIVTPTDGGAAWELTDLLARSMGSIKTGRTMCSPFIRMAKRW